MALRIFIIDDHDEFRALLRQHLHTRWPAAELLEHDPATEAPLAQDFAGQGGDWGPMNWSDPRVADALAALPSARHDAAPLRRQVAQTLHTALPLIPVLWYRQTLAANPALAGVSIDPYQRSYRLTELRDTREARDRRKNPQERQRDSRRASAGA